MARRDYGFEIADDVQPTDADDRALALATTS
jgi:hypothetical protein